MIGPPDPPGPSSAGPRLLGPVEVRARADALGFRPTKRLGQTFVVDPNTARRIARAAGVGADDVVLEIGPGFGSLTLALLAAGCRVVAVEVDPVLAGALAHTVQDAAPDHGGRLTVVQADAAKVAVLPGPQPTALVANLPYNVAVPVLLHLLDRFPSLGRGLVMVQDDVARRLAAPPGSRTYGGPSVKLAWYADVRLAGQVPRTVFWPVPNVDSALVALHRRDPPPSAVDRSTVFAAVDAAFGQRRKTLRTSLAGLAGSRAAAVAVLAQSDLPAGARAEELDVHQFARLGEALAAVGSRR